MSTHGATVTPTTSLPVNSSSTESNDKGDSGMNLVSTIIVIIAVIVVVIVAAFILLRRHFRKRGVSTVRIPLQRSHSKWSVKTHDPNSGAKHQKKSDHNFVPGIWDTINIPTEILEQTNDKAGRTDDCEHQAQLEQFIVLPQVEQSKAKMAYSTNLSGRRELEDASLQVHAHAYQSDTSSDDGSDAEFMARPATLSPTSAQVPLSREALLSNSDNTVSPTLRRLRNHSNKRQNQRNHNIESETFSTLRRPDNSPVEKIEKATLRRQPKAVNSKIDSQNVRSSQARNEGEQKATLRRNSSISMQSETGGIDSEVRTDFEVSSGRNRHLPRSVSGHGDRPSNLSASITAWNEGKNTPDTKRTSVYSMDSHGAYGFESQHSSRRGSLNSSNSPPRSQFESMLSSLGRTASQKSSVRSEFETLLAGQSGGAMGPSKVGSTANATLNDTVGTLSNRTKSVQTSSHRRDRRRHLSDVSLASASSEMTSYGFAADEEEAAWL